MPRLPRAPAGEQFVGPSGKVWNDLCDMVEQAYTPMTVSWPLYYLQLGGTKCLAYLGGTAQPLVPLFNFAADAGSGIYKLHTTAISSDPISTASNITSASVYTVPSGATEVRGFVRGELDLRTTRHDLPLNELVVGMPGWTFTDGTNSYPGYLLLPGFDIDAPCVTG